VVDKIMRYGVVKGTQYGNKQKGIMGITWVIENEDVDNLNRNRLAGISKKNGWFEFRIHQSL
jgi:hypothetical protein